MLKMDAYGTNAAKRFGQPKRGYSEVQWTEA